MKYSMDTYRLYADEKIFRHSVRVKVLMKAKVDLDVLQHAVNVAIRRYPYFAVEVTLGDDGGYDLIPNKREIVVMETPEELPGLGSDEVNRHLLYVDCKGHVIYFNISHSLCGGRGLMPWVMTSVYQYVVEKYNVVPDAPGIRKPDSGLLEGETTEPSLEMLSDEPPAYQHISKKPVVMLWDYLNGMYNPLIRNPNYYQFSFKQSEIVAFAKENNASVAAFFLITMAMALDRVLPKKHKVIGGETAHFPGADIGLPDSHCDLLTHAYIDYERESLHGSLKELGTMTRKEIDLQIDPSVSNDLLRKLFSFWEQLVDISGLKNKRAYYAKVKPFSGKDAKHGTFISNYTGRMDWGEVAKYVDSYYILVDGHLLLEVTAMADKIFLSFMQLIKETKYVNAYCQVLNEMGITYKKRGPFRNIRPKHKLPTP